MPCDDKNTILGSLCIVYIYTYRCYLSIYYRYTIIYLYHTSRLSIFIHIDVIYLLIDVYYIRYIYIYIFDVVHLPNRFSVPQLFNNFHLCM